MSGTKRYVLFRILASIIFDIFIFSPDGVDRRLDRDKLSIYILRITRRLCTSDPCNRTSFIIAHLGTGRLRLRRRLTAPGAEAINLLLIE